MYAQDMQRHDQGTVPVHVCFCCSGIWFDHLASPQLAPAAVIELFKEIQSHRAGAVQPLAKALACPRCTDALALSFDLGKAGRFSYYRCHRGDGRFTPFVQFLREKQFIRALTPLELERVRSQVRQITCSECGAPIDLEHASECRYCHAPISFLDPQALERAVTMWSDAATRGRARPSTEAVANAILLSNGAAPNQLGRANSAGLGTRPNIALGIGAAILGPDLVSLGIDLIGALFGD